MDDAIAGPSGSSGVIATAAPSSAPPAPAPDIETGRPSGEIPPGLLSDITESMFGPFVIFEPPSGQDVLLDIVFVHGLMGHPIKTWLYGKMPQSGEDGEGSKRLFGKLFKSKQADIKNSARSHCYWPLLLGQELKW